jgi:hypothetical protein
VYKGKDQSLSCSGGSQSACPNICSSPMRTWRTTGTGSSSSGRTNKRGKEILDSNDTFVSHFRYGKISEFCFASDDPYKVDAFLG